MWGETERGETGKEFWDPDHRGRLRTVKEFDPLPKEAGPVCSPLRLGELLRMSS